MHISKNDFLSPKSDSENVSEFSDLRTSGFGFIPQIHKDEIMRNRRRVKEIHQYVDHVQNELDNLECSEIID